MNPLTSASTAWQEISAGTEISVLNPDNPHDKPIYEGAAADATHHLAPGRYIATGLDGHSNFELTVGPQAQPVEIEGEWAPGVRVGAVTFADSAQGFGEPAYWVDGESLRALHDYGEFGHKSAYDEDMSSSYLSFSSDGTPLEHTGVENADGTTDPTRTTATPLESREYQGRTYYSLAGYSFDEAQSEYGYGTPDDASVERVVAQASALDDATMERLAEDHCDQNEGTWGDDFIRARQSCDAARDAHIFETDIEDPSVLDWPSSRAHEATTRQLRFGRRPGATWNRAPEEGHPAWAAGAAAADAARAVGARDLIGKVPGWDQKAYDTLTGVWRRNVGPVHPDDAPPPRRWG